MKVAILGTVPASRHIAPFDDPSWEIWVCSPGNRGQCPRVTRWFELHSLVDMAGPENNVWRPDYYAWLRGQNFPIYMQEKSEMFPQAIVYPRDAMIAKFGRRWFTSSVAWMMALALHEMSRLPGEQHQIGIFGVDMAADQEYHTQQKAGCMRFIEFAEAQGVEVFIPLESCLAVPPPLYGYAEGSRMGRKLVVREFEIDGQIQQIDATIAKLRDELCYFRGARDNNSYVRRTFVDGMDCILDTENAQARQAKQPVSFSTVPLTPPTPKPELPSAQVASAGVGAPAPDHGRIEGLDPGVPHDAVQNGKAGDIQHREEYPTPRRVEPTEQPGA